VLGAIEGFSARELHNQICILKQPLPLAAVYRVDYRGSQGATWVI
jgi:hypothetical protein